MVKVLALHPERCTGCVRCELACSYMQTGTFQPSKSVIRVSPFEGYTSYAPYTCTQCEEGWCMTACPVGAITITAAGAKDVIDDKCVGCKLCTIACPYGTMFYDGDTKKAYKCNLCGGAPACAAACPTEAITYEDLAVGDWIGDFAARADGAPPAGRVRRSRRPRGGAVMATRHVIIGGGTAGLNCIRTIREEEASPSEITLVSAERPYSRMVLPYYLGESIAESHVFTATPASLAAWKTKTMIGRKATRLDAQNHTVTLDDGATVEYDDCLIATGSRAAKPPIPGADGPGVHCFWTLDEARAVIAGVTPGSRVVMVGAGFIAFTILNAILSRGAQLTIVEVAPRILPRMVDAACAEIVARLARPAPRDAQDGGDPQEDRGGARQAQAHLRTRRPVAGRRGHHGHRDPDQPRMARRLRHRDEPGGRRRDRRGRSPAIERKERLRGGRRGAGAKPRERRPRGPRHRADRPGARPRGRRQHGGAGPRLPRKSRDEYRRGLSPRHRVLRPVGTILRPRSIRRRDAIGPSTGNSSSGAAGSRERSSADPPPISGRPTTSACSRGWSTRVPTSAAGSRTWRGTPSTSSRPSWPRAPWRGFCPRRCSDGLHTHPNSPNRWWSNEPDGDGEALPKKAAAQTAPARAATRASFSA